jgi:hypothetical protein
MLLDSGGRPLEGHVAAFRSAFATGGTDLYGSNDNTSNGIFSTSPLGVPSAANLIGGRAFELEPFGPLDAATAPNANPGDLIGEFTAVYRFYYVPSPSISGSREVEFSAVGITARYRFANFAGSVVAPAVPIPDQTITFLVPSPSAAALLAPTLILAARRRRGISGH